MAKFKNLIFVFLLIALFVEVLIIFPNKLEHEETEVYVPMTREEREIADQKEAEAAAEEAKKNPKSLVAEQKMQGVHLVESQKGVRDWELFADAAEGSQGTANWKLKKIRVFFYTLEKVEFTVVGDEGNIDAKSKNLVIRGNVVTKSTNGYVFKTPSISYSSANRQIQSPEAVTMSGPPDKTGGGIVLSGTNMTAYVDSSRMVIHKNVRATKALKENKKFEVTADSAEFSGKNNEARFFGTVRVNYDGMKLEGPEASFLYQAGANVLSTVAVKGGVKVSDADKFATSESVNLDLLANKYVFKGRPRVVQNNDELTGEEIIFLDGGKRVKVENVRAKVENKER
ncbi:Lipopolysaccharide export system protein LptC [compost metagenome]